MKNILSLPAVALFGALAAANPLATAEDTLRIPVSAITSNSLSTYSAHPLFGKYQAWVSSNPGFAQLRGNATAAATQYPTLDAIECTFSSCFFLSSVEIPTEVRPEIAARSALSALLGKRQNANQLISYTHWKTYYQGDEGGAEHYTNWNLLCWRLEYRSTQFVVQHSWIDSYGSNDMATFIDIYAHVHGQHRQLRLQQNYACAWYRNQCCTSYTYVTNRGSGQVTGSTWECYRSTRASACQG